MELQNPRRKGDVALAASVGGNAPLSLGHSSPGSAEAFSPSRKQTASGRSS